LEKFELNLDLSPLGLKVLSFLRKLFLRLLFLNVTILSLD